MELWIGWWCGGTVVSTQSDSHARGRENNLLLDASPRNINQGVHARWKTPLNRGVNARTSFHYGIECAPLSTVLSSIILLMILAAPDMRESDEVRSARFIYRY